MIKAILLDVDGTLTNSQKEISPRTREALEKAQRAGIRLAIVSARTERGVLRFGRWLDFDHNHGILICCNGTYIVDAESGEVIYDRCMPTEVSTAILEKLKGYDVLPIIAYGEYMNVNDVFAGMLHITDPQGNEREFNVIEYESRSNEYILCEKKDLAAFFADKPIPKILVAAQPEYLAKVAPEFAAPFQDTTTNLFTTPFYYEFNPAGVDKASAITAAFARLRISPDEMMAFGDQQNDIPMISAVKYGIAMGNATDAAKKAAFDVTADNDHDGIADAIYKYIPELAD